MKRKHSRVAATFIFASAAITCSLPVRATPPPQGNAREQTIRQCEGSSPTQIPSPFSDHYSCLSLGSVPGVPTSYGGFTFKYDDPKCAPNRRRRQYFHRTHLQIEVTRDANMHITGFSGPARLCPSSTSRIGHARKKAQFSMTAYGNCFYGDYEPLRPSPFFS